MKSYIFKEVHKSYLLEKSKIKIKTNNIWNWIYNYIVQNNLTKTDFDVEFKDYIEVSTNKGKFRLYEKK